MNNRSLTCLLFLAVVALAGVWVPLALAQGSDPTPTAEATVTFGATSTLEPTPSPTLLPSTPEPLTVAGVEPKTIINDRGGTLSVYGTGFTTQSAVRLIGYGLLSTSYANGTALTAQVPAGVSLGIYDVEVGDGTHRATLPQALAIVAPTPTPKPRAPVSPPLPGRPILTVRNYTVEPAQVRAGQEFVVTIEIYNNGSRAGENTIAIFPGDPFLPVGEPGHIIGQIHINHLAVVTQRMRAPSTISSGVHQLTVNLGANDWEGNHYDYPQHVPVEVVGGGSVAPVGKPKLITEGAGSEPPILSPGEPFTLTLRLANRGSRTALDVFASVASSDMAVPSAGASTVATERVGAGEVVTVTLPLLLLSEVDAGGRQVLVVALEYSDATGGTYEEQQNVGIDVDTGLSRRPQLVITEYGTTPGFLTPGDTFTLTMRVVNVGGGDAERLTLALGGEGGAHLEPFIPLNAGNVIFVPLVEAGTSVEVVRQLAVDGSANPKAYSLPLALGYDGSGGNRQEDIQRLSLVVRRRAELRATFYREPVTLTVGSPTALSLELINVGLSAVNVVELNATSAQMEVEAEGTPFMGPLDMGGSAPLDVTVTPQEGGRAELVISVTYRDDFNHLQVLTRTLTVEVTSSPTGPVGPTAPGGMAEEQLKQTVWRTIARAVRGFLGFGS